jgi:cyanocobalamin reductase (cyanide-eliminating) / alkylcobalamin dealkylase
MRDVDIAALRARCEEAGLDIVHPFRMAWFNDEVEPFLRLPDWGRADALGILIGNTARIWPAFTRALRDEGALLGDEHPLDTYVERSLSGAAGRAISDRHVILFAHRMVPAPIAIQRVAHAAGLAHLSPSRLSVHPAYGPWLALRAVIVVDTDGPSEPRPRAPDPCTPCSKPCLLAFERALTATDMTRSGDVERTWQMWANVREVCPEGTDSRYGDDQLRYHYTKDPSILRRPAR